MVVYVDAIPVSREKVLSCLNDVRLMSVKNWVEEEARAGRELEDLAGPLCQKLGEILSSVEDHFMSAIGESLADSFFAREVEFSFKRRDLDFEDTLYARLRALWFIMVDSASGAIAREQEEHMQYMISIGEGPRSDYVAAAAEVRRLMSMRRGARRRGREEPMDYSSQ